MKSNDLGLQNLKQEEENLALRRIGCNIESLSSTSGQARQACNRSEEAMITIITTFLKFVE